MTFLISLFVFSLHADYLPDVRIETITRYLPELQHLTEGFEAGDIVVFDLDNTVFRESQMLGTDEWYYDMLRRAPEGLPALNYAIKHRSPMRLMEDELPQFIHELQSEAF